MSRILLISMLVVFLSLEVTLSFSTAGRRQSTRNHNNIPALYSAVAESSVLEQEVVLTKVRDSIEEATGTMDAWDECSDYLSSRFGLSLPTEEAEMLYATALDWKAWAKVTILAARKYLNPQPPNLSQLQSAIAWLEEQSWTEEEIVKAIRKSPKAYLIDPETAYKESFDSAPKAVRGSFDDLLRQEPGTIEYNFNCEDTGCSSECGNCWVIYELKQGRK